MLTELLASDPQSIADVIAILESIDSSLAPADGLKWFNSLYLQITQAVAARVAAKDFANPDWIAQLDVQFAKLYLRALRSSLAGEPAPDCWQVLFDSRADTRIARIQFALAGVNAHINHDLCAAVVATCRATGVTPAHGAAPYADYTALNSTLDAQIDSAKQTLHVRLLGDALPPVSHLEDTLAAWNVAAARETAWCNSEILWNMGALSDVFLGTLDGLATVIGKALLVPVPSA